MNYSVTKNWIKCTSNEYTFIKTKVYWSIVKITKVNAPMTLTLLHLGVNECLSTQLKEQEKRILSSLINDDRS